MDSRGYGVAHTHKTRGTNHEMKPYRLYWYDKAKSIHVIEAFARWTWDDAHQAIDEQNEILTIAPHPVYAVIHLLPHVNGLPAGGHIGPDAIRNVQWLFENDPRPEELCVVVGNNGLVRDMINIVRWTYNMFDLDMHYLYAGTLSGAANIIAAHQAQATLDPLAS